MYRALGSFQTFHGEHYFRFLWGRQNHELPKHFQKRRRLAKSILDRRDREVNSAARFLDILKFSRRHEIFLEFQSMWFVHSHCQFWWLYVFVVSFQVCIGIPCHMLRCWAFLGIMFQVRAPASCLFRLASSYTCSLMTVAVSDNICVMVLQVPLVFLTNYLQRRFQNLMVSNDPNLPLAQT